MFDENGSFSGFVGLVSEKSWGICKKWKFLVQNLVFFFLKKSIPLSFQPLKNKHVCASGFFFVWEEFSALILP